MPGYRLTHVLLTCGALFVLIKVGMVNLIELRESVFVLAGLHGTTHRFSYPGLLFVAIAVLVCREGICRTLFPRGAEHREPGLDRLYHVAFPVLGVLLCLVSIPRMSIFLFEDPGEELRPHPLRTAVFEFQVDLVLCVLGTLMLVRPAWFTALARMGSRPDRTTGWWARDGLTSAFLVVLGLWHVSVGASEYLAEVSFRAWRDAEWMLIETQGYYTPSREREMPGHGAARIGVGVLLWLAARFVRRRSPSGELVSISQRAFVPAITFLVGGFVCLRYAVCEGADLSTEALSLLPVPWPVGPVHVGLAALVCVSSAVWLRVVARRGRVSGGVLSRRQHLAGMLGLYAWYAVAQSLVAFAHAQNPFVWQLLQATDQLVVSIVEGLFPCVVAVVFFFARRRIAALLLAGQADDLDDEPHALILAGVACAGFDVVLHSLPYMRVMVPDPWRIATVTSEVSGGALLFGLGVMALAPVVARVVTGPASLTSVSIR